MLIEVNCETDFVARNDEFQKLVHDVAMQVAGLAPLYVRREDIPADVLEPKKSRPAAQTSRVRQARGDPRRRWSRASSRSGTSEVCLMEQPFRDEDRTVQRPRDASRSRRSARTSGSVASSRYVLGEEL